MTANLSSQRILVVDDDREIVRLVRAYLEQAGYNVLWAYDGETALRILRADRPDLLVLDLMLPDRDGWDVTRTVRQDERLKSTPIIILTARRGDADKIVGLELGADDYVTKPFNPREVVARVRSVLRRSLKLDSEDEAQGILQWGGLLLDLDRRELLLDGIPVSLTQAEARQLSLLHKWGRLRPHTHHGRSEAGEADLAPACKKRSFCG